MHTLRTTLESSGRKAMKHCRIPGPVASRQMRLVFDADGSVGLEAADREKAVTALAQILMQAAGLHIEETVDDRR